MTESLKLYGDVWSYMEDVRIDTNVSVDDTAKIIVSIFAYRLYKLVSSNQEIDHVIKGVKHDIINNVNHPLHRDTMTDTLLLIVLVAENLFQIRDIEIAKVEFTEENKIRICSFISKEEFQSLVADKLMKEEDTLRYIK